MSEHFREGREAFIYEHPFSGCPYPVETQERFDWENGWQDAQGEAEAKDGGEHTYGEDED